MNKGIFLCLLASAMIFVSCGKDLRPLNIKEELSSSNSSSNGNSGSSGSSDFSGYAQVLTGNYNYSTKSYADTSDAEMDQVRIDQKNYYVHTGSSTAALALIDSLQDFKGYTFEISGDFVKNQMCMPYGGCFEMTFFKINSIR